ncbi:MAG: hypothetical protein H8D45_24535 [Bacteroidetes bacterium]|nr:hypothetical protein [Bacteroidota bacterium]MBL7104495.1 hypothetical protein [Bacteroidales bacterium]
MPSSHYEPIFYSLCLKAMVPTFALMQDLKQSIEKKKIKNIDFICYSEKKIFLIDVKGTNNLTGDTKISNQDIEALKLLMDIYGTNATGLIIYIWTKPKYEYIIKEDLLLHKFKVKAIDINLFEDNLKWSGKWSNSSKNIYYRCKKNTLKNIWDYIPNFKSLIE